MIGCGPAFLASIGSVVVFSVWMFTGDVAEELGSGEAWGVLLFGGVGLVALLGGLLSYLGFVAVYVFRVRALEPDAEIQRYVIELLAVGGVTFLVVVAALIYLF